MELVTGATGYVGGAAARAAPGRGAPRARARARRRRGSTPRDGVEPAGGDLLSRPRHRARRSTAATTAYYLVHSMEAADDPDFAGRDRRAGRELRRRRARRGRGAHRLPGRASRPPTGEPSPHIASRMEVEEILLEAAPVGHRAAGLDRDRRAARPPSGCWCGWSSACASCPARLAAQPAPSRSPSATRSSTWPARPQVAEAAGRSLDIVGPDVVSYGEMIERIAEAMGVGPDAAGARRLAHAPRQRGGERGDRAAAGAGAPADGEPRVTSCSRATPTRPPRMYGIRPLRFDRAVEHALAEWERTRGAGGAMKVERDIEIAAPARGGLRPDRRPRPARRLGHDPPVRSRQARPTSCAKGAEAHTVPEARGPQLQGELDGGRERPPEPAGVGGQGPVRSKAKVVNDFRRPTRAPASPTSTSTTLPGGPLGNMAGPVVRRVTGKELDESLQKLERATRITVTVT